MIKKNINLFLFYLIFSLFTHCTNGDKTISCFPNTSINVALDLGLPSNQNLASINGYVYVQAGPLSGTRGLIVINTSQGFVAYDRNAPHICPSESSTLEVVDDFYILCPDDGAQWLFNGQPIGDKAAGRPPKSYPAQLIGNMVYINYN